MPAFHRPSVLRPLHAALLALGLGTTALALAQSPMPNMPGMQGMGGPGHTMQAHGPGGHEAMHDKMAARRTQRLNELKQKLALTPDQETAWKTWTTAMQPRGPQHDADHAKMRDEMVKLTTPERIERMRAMRAQHQAAMDQRAEATKAFYAALTPDQRKVFDAQTARMMQPMMGMGERMHRHPE